MSWRRLVSRCGVPTAPREYFVATMLVALLLHSAGNSTPRCSQLIEPARQVVMTTSRRSQVTSSYGCTPAVVKTRLTFRPCPLVDALPARRVRPAKRSSVSVTELSLDVWSWRLGKSRSPVLLGLCLSGGADSSGGAQVLLERRRRVTGGCGCMPGSGGVPAVACRARSSLIPFSKSSTEVKDR